MRSSKAFGIKGRTINIQQNGSRDISPSVNLRSSHQKIHDNRNSHGYLAMKHYNRQYFLRTAGLILLWSLLMPCSLSAKEPGKRPNVLFIAIDDLRPELGCYGADHIPNIDKFASQGVLFKPLPRLADLLVIVAHGDSYPEIQRYSFEARGTCTWKGDSAGGLPSSRLLHGW